LEFLLPTVSEAATPGVAATQSQIPTYVKADQAQVELLKITVSNDGSTLTSFDELIAKITGTTASISTYYLIYDKNTDGKISGGDEIAASTSVITGGEVTLDLGPTYADDISGVNGTLTYFLAIDVAGASNGDTFDARIETNKAIFNSGDETYPSAWINPTGYITVDKSAPTISARETADTNNDGYIDRIVMTATDLNGLDDDFNGLTVTVAGATVTGYASGTPYDKVFYVNLADGALTTGATPAVQITANTTLSDYYSGTYSFDLGNNIGIDVSGVNATDKAAPVLLSALLKSSTTVDLTFSENIAFYADEATTKGKITLKGVNPTGITINTTVATLTFGTNLGTVAITDNAQDLEIAAQAFKDTANALAVVADKDVADGAGPEILTAVADDGATPGTGADGVDAGDRVIITWSEGTNAPAIDKTNINTVLALTPVHTWLDGAGNIGGAVWSGTGNNTLTITLSAGISIPTVVVGDTITPSNAITDGGTNSAAGNKAISGSFNDVTAPTISTIELTSSTTVDVTFNENINFIATHDNTPGATSFAGVTVKGITASTGSITGAVLTLTFTENLGTVAIDVGSNGLSLTSIIEDEATAKTFLRLLPNGLLLIKPARN